MCAPSQIAGAGPEVLLQILWLTGYLLIRKAVFGQISSSDAYPPPSSKPPRPHISGAEVSGSSEAKELWDLRAAVYFYIWILFLQ